VNFVGDAAEADARELIALATQLRGLTQGSVRADCEEHIARAERFLDPIVVPARGAAVERRRELDEDPVELARRAHSAGLTWLSIRRGEDAIAVAMRSALDPESGASPAPVNLVDAVEAEGWRLAHVVCVFRPTKIQTSVLRGADLLGGDIVQGDEEYLYLFRRGDAVSG